MAAVLRVDGARAGKGWTETVSFKRWAAHFAYRRAKDRERDKGESLCVLYRGGDDAEERA